MKSHHDLDNIQKQALTRGLRIVSAGEYVTIRPEHMRADRLGTGAVPENINLIHKFVAMRVRLDLLKPQNLPHNKITLSNPSQRILGTKHLNI